MLLIQSEWWSEEETWMYKTRDVQAQRVQRKRHHLNNKRDISGDTKHTNALVWRSSLQIFEKNQAELFQPPTMAWIGTLPYKLMWERLGPYSWHRLARFWKPYKVGSSYNGMLTSLFTAAMNTGVQIFLWHTDLISFEYLFRRRT